MHNEQSSAPTSHSERLNRIPLSEADYLAREITDAKAALSQAVADLSSGLTSTADLQQWIKRYPWAALGAATVAGFAAAVALTPSRGEGETVAEQPSPLRPAGESEAGESGVAPPAHQQARAAGAYDLLVSALFDLAKTLVQTLILATVRSATMQSQAKNGAPPDPRETRMGRS
jgi:hypothetical protein